MTPDDTAREAATAYSIEYGLLMESQSDISEAFEAGAAWARERAEEERDLERRNAADCIRQRVEQIENLRAQAACLREGLELIADRASYEEDMDAGDCWYAALDRADFTLSRVKEIEGG